MRAPQLTQHCPPLTKEQRATLDAASRQYGLPWHAKAGRHYKLYLGDVFITVISLSRDRNDRAPQRPEERLRKQIHQVMNQRLAG